MKASRVLIFLYRRRTAGSPFTMAEPGAPNGYLDPSQGNALVYSTLCGFMLIGLWAGYNTRSKRDFISGVRTQSGM